MCFYRLVKKGSFLKESILFFQNNLIANSNFWGLLFRLHSNKVNRQLLPFVCNISEVCSFVRLKTLLSLRYYKASHKLLLSETKAKVLCKCYVCTTVD